MENKKEKIDFIKNEPENLDDYFTDFYEEDIELLEEDESMLEEVNDLALVIEEQIFMLDYVYETYNRLLKKYSDIEVINMIKDVYLRFYKEFDEEKYKKDLLELV
jgi:hypothetical protein